MILASTSDAPANSLGYAYVIPPPKDRVEFEERFGTKVIWQAWGMTEIFPHFPTKTRIETTSDDPIGLAPRWVDYGIVDEDDQLLGPGALGEMVYRPLEPFSMASGYFGDPVATASAYRNFMFHSGDVGYYDEDFAVHIVSRNQDFVRRRGESVSVVELETIARNHPDVRDAIAYGVLDHVGEHEVKLDVILRRAISLDLLHAWLVDQLPRYMVPRFIEARTDFPRGLNQVVEKYQLAKEPLDRDSVKEYLPAKRKSKN
jgi:crotonobetaine/carnitine-CoA ligase